MARKLFVVSLTVCLVSIGLSQILDPGILGIREEPSIILFYGGFGLLAGLSGLLALGSGSYLAISRLVTLSAGQRRLLLLTFLIILGAIVIFGVIRFIPIR
jgi:hypothetical protein